jgi:hypothetical protein
MDRRDWLAERQAAVVASYDSAAPGCDALGYPAGIDSATGPPHPARRDGPGRAVRTGRYFPMVAAVGHRVAGADRSASMLARVAARSIAFSLELMPCRTCRMPTSSTRS